MLNRRSAYDVTDSVNVTEPSDVCHEVCRLYAELYPDISTAALEQAFEDMEKLFLGQYRGYLACEAPYHDLQHSLDVTLAMTRLIHGHEQAHTDRGRIGHLGALLGIISALFHDSGYIRRWNDHRHSNGSEYTSTHVSRGGRFLSEYLPTLGLAHAVPICSHMLHFTGYEMPVRQIPLDDLKLRRLGKMMGTADLLAQMSDRCYLEKCRDRLYPEFVASGMAAPDAPGGGYRSAEELLGKTPFFFKHVQDRLHKDFRSMYRHLDTFFAELGNLYMDEVVRNNNYLASLLEANDLSLLRRVPPWTLNRDIQQIDPHAYA
ncbi:MAG: hypothetical protein R8L58_01020 [Mariprofundaceae bacterium]